MSTHSSLPIVLPLGLLLTAYSHISKPSPSSISALCLAPSCTSELGQGENWIDTSIVDKMTEKKVTLISSDHKIFEVEESVVLEWQTFKDMMEDMDTEGVIPLPMCRKVLDQVIQYCSYHLDCHKISHENSKSSPEDIKKWDAEFVKVDYDSLAALTSAANYLNISSLFDLACQAVADMIRGKTVQQFRKICNLTNDLTQEEQEERISLPINLTGD